MCCLFGLYDYGGTLSAKQKNRMIAALAAASEVRGIDATGIAYCMNGLSRRIGCGSASRNRQPP